MIISLFIAVPVKKKFDLSTSTSPYLKTLVNSTLTLPYSNRRHSVVYNKAMSSTTGGDD